MTSKKSAEINNSFFVSKNINNGVKGYLDYSGFRTGGKTLSLSSIYFLGGAICQ